MLRHSKTTQTFIAIDNGDFKFAGTFPDTTPENECKLRVDTFDTKWTGSIGKDSKLTTGIVEQDEAVNLFLEANLDAELDVTSGVRMSIGKKVVGKCIKGIARDTVHVDLKAKGKALVKARVGLVHE